MGDKKVNEEMEKVGFQVLVQIRDLTDGRLDKGLLTILEYFGEPLQMLEDHDNELRRIEELAEIAELSEDLEETKKQEKP